MLEFKKIVIEVSVFGEKYRISKPNGLRVQKWLSDIDELDNKEKADIGEDVELAATLLEECGMDKEAFKSMYEDDQITLMNAVVTAKKE